MIRTARLFFLALYFGAPLTAQAVPVLGQGYQTLPPLFATVLVDAYWYKKPSGVIGDSTDDTPAIQAAENATPAGGTLKFTPGRKYFVYTSVTNAIVIRNSHIWDLTGATLKYGGSANVTTGSDGGAIGMVNVNSTPFIVIEGTLDGNGKVGFPLTVQGRQASGVFFNFLTIQNTLEASSSWNGIAFTTSQDVTGISIGDGARAQGISGHLYRPNCPLVDANNNITAHANSGATLVPGGAFAVGNATGYALATAGTENTTVHITNGTARGIPTFMTNTAGTNTTNNVWNDIIAYDGGFRHQELYGAILYATLRQTFSSGGAYTPGYCEQTGGAEAVVHVITVSANVAVTVNNPSLGCAPLGVDRLGEIRFVVRNSSGGALTTPVAFTGALYKVTGTVSPGTGQQIVIDMQYDTITNTIQEVWRSPATNF